MGVIQGDTRGLDYSSWHSWVRFCASYSPKKTLNPTTQQLRIASAARPEASELPPGLSWQPLFCSELGACNSLKQGKETCSGMHPSSAIAMELLNPEVFAPVCCVQVNFCRFEKSYFPEACCKEETGRTSSSNFYADLSISPQS